MCTVVLSFIRRLFSSFVLVCFLWTTLFQTIAFADYTRAQPDPVVYVEQGDITYAHLNVGIQTVKRVPSPTEKDVYIFEVDKSPELVIAFHKTREETQRQIDEKFADSVYKQLTVVEDGLTWLYQGMHFYRYTSGDLIVTKSATSVSNPSSAFHLYNFHGTTVLEDDLPYDYLIVSGKDVIQNGNRLFNTLSLRINGTLVNKNNLSVTTVLLDGSLRKPITPSHEEHEDAPAVPENTPMDSVQPEPSTDPTLSEQATSTPHDEIPAFIEHAMPGTDHASALYSLGLKDKAGNTVRQQATQLFLAHAKDDTIRHLMVPEITDKAKRGELNTHLPEATQLHEKLTTAKKVLDKEVARVNQLKGSNLSAPKLLALDPKQKDTEFIQLQLKLEGVTRVGQDISEWAARETTYREYVERHLSQPNTMLECVNNIHNKRTITGSIDALAKILKTDLKIYIKTPDNQDTFKLAHEFTRNTTINIVYVAHDPTQPHVLNHFNRLEETYTSANEGPSFDEYKMPGTDNACALYSLGLKDKAGNTVRQQAVQLLLTHAKNDTIRHLMASEIKDKAKRGELNTRLPEAAQLHERLVTAKKILDEEVARVNQLKGTTLSATKLLELDPQLKDTTLQEVRSKQVALTRVGQDISEWAAFETTYRDYVERHLAQPNVMLEFINDVHGERKMTSSIDVLAKILNIDLKIYVKAHDTQGTFILAHEFDGSSKRSINMVYVAHDPNQPEILNHFNILEEKPKKAEDGRAAAQALLAKLEQDQSSVTGSVDTNTQSDTPKNSVCFANEGTFNADDTTTFGIAKPISNTKTMHFGKDVIVSNDTIQNNGAFEIDGKMKGTLNALYNADTLHAKQGFDNLNIQYFINSRGGTLQGDGQLAIGSASHESNNDGHIKSSTLELKLNGAFRNTNHIHVAEVFKTSGEGIFYQKGDLNGKTVFINNTQFESEQSLNQPKLDLVFGAKVTTVHNNTEVHLRTKTLTFAKSESQDSIATNAGTLNTGHFDNGIATFINEEHITATSWNQHGATFTNRSKATLDVNGSATFDTERLTNDGDITIQGDITGRIDHLTNTGGFNTNGDNLLTIQHLHNTKTMQSTHTFGWQGETFTSTKDAKLLAEKIELKTPKPLTLDGTVHSSQGATFDTPSLVNTAALTVDTNKTTIKGTLSNQNVMQLDELAFEGKTLSNTDKGTLNANLYTQNVKLDLLDNKGTIHISKGGLDAKTINNSGKLTLLDGLYQADTFNNKGGEATIDKLSITSPTVTLAGTVNVSQFVSAQTTYAQIKVDGITTLASGGFHTKELTINGTLTLGKGHYRIDLLKGDKKAKLLLQAGAHVTVGGIEYDGDIVSSVDLTLDPLMKKEVSPAASATASTPSPNTASSAPVQKIADTTAQRSTAFNAIPTASPSDATKKKETVTQHTKSITDILKDKSKVSEGRFATDAERKTILQSLMSSTLTSLFDSPEQYRKLSLTPQLPTLRAIDPLFKHFEILRLTEQLSYTLAQQVTARGRDALEDILNDTLDQNTLTSYSGVTKDMFLMWFKEVFDAHKTGFLKPVKPSPAATKLDMAKTLFDTHTHRCDTYNSPLSAFDTGSAAKRDAIYTDTAKLTDILKNTKKVDVKRHATAEERKIILQAVIGSEITAHLHDPAQQAKLTLSPQIPTLDANDPVFKHVEILRLTEKLAHTLVQQVTTHGDESIDLAFTKSHADIKMLRSYSGIEYDMFMLWFKEVFAKHKAGFSMAQTGYAPNEKPIMHIWKEHHQRCSAFNVIPDTSPADAIKKKEEVAQHTQSITTLLNDTKKVSTRKATDAERKVILQAVMASEVTAPIRNADEYKKLTLTSHFPVLTQKDSLFRHFEVLRLTEKVSRTMVHQITENGLSAITSTIGENEDLQTLCTYSGLEADMLLLWFKEVLERHTFGFFVPRTASLSILPTETGDYPDITRIHTITIQKDFTLTTKRSLVNSNWVGSFLNTHKDRLKFVKNLFLDVDVFSNTKPLDLPYHVHIKTRLFNPRNSLTTKGMTLRATEAKIGSDNQHMVKIICNGPVDALVDQTVDVRFGVWQSTHAGIIRSAHGNILVGARKDINDSTVIKNGAMITSNEELILQAREGTVLNAFGVVHGSKLLQYDTKKLENISADGTSDTLIIVNVDDLDHKVLNEIYPVKTGRTGHDGTYYRYCYSYPMSDPYGNRREIYRERDVENHSEIYGQKMKAESSVLRCTKGSIVINSKNPPKVLGSHFISNDSLYWKHGNHFLDVPDGENGTRALNMVGAAEITSIPLHDYFNSTKAKVGPGNGDLIPQFASAKKLVIELPKSFLHFEGAGSSQQISITVNGVRILNTSGRRQPTNTNPVMVSVNAVADSLLNTPLVNKEVKGRTTSYTRNTPGAHHPTPPIAVFSIPRSFTSNKTDPSTQLVTPLDVIFDMPTLEALIMNGQMAYMGRIHEKGADLLPWMIQNGLDFQQELLNTNQEVSKALIMQSKDPKIFYWMGKLYVFFPPDMHMPYDKTSGNIQASDRVEILADTGGIDEDGATVGGGKGGVIYKTENKGNYTAQSQTKRTLRADGYDETIGVSNLCEATDGDINKDIDGVIFFTGDVKHDAGKGSEKPHELNLNGNEGVFGVETMLERLSVEEVLSRVKSGTKTTTILTPVTQNFTSSGTIRTTSKKGRVEINAPTISSVLGAEFRGKLGAKLGEVHRVEICEENVRKQGNGFTTQNKNIQHATMNETSFGATATRGSVLVGSEEGDAIVTNVQIDDLLLEAVNGITRVLLGTNRFVEQEIVTGKSWYYQSMAYKVDRHETFVESKIKRLRTKAKETEIQSIQGRTVEFMNRIELDGGILTETFLKEIHDSIEDERGNITASFAIVLAVAATALTAGAGAAVGGAIAGGMGMTTGSAAFTLTSTVVGAGFQSMCAQAAVALAANKGDLGKALKSVKSKESLNSIGISMLSAGVAQGLNTCFKVPASASSIGTIGKHAAHHSIAMVSKMGAEAAINRRTDGKGAALTAVASILGAKLANEIGDLNACGKIDFMTHKVLHALKGAAGGLIVGGKDGMKAGALGAFVAEFVAEAITPTNGIDHKHDTYSKKRVHITKEVSKVVAGLVAVAVGMDPADVSIAILEATTSVDNNFEHSLKKRNGGLETIEEEDEEDGYSSDGSVDDTDDEAKKSTVGQLREGYIEPLAKAAKAVGLDKVAQAEADVNNEFGGTVTEFVEAQLALREQRTGEPLTNAERAKLSGQYEQMYDAYATGNGFKEIAEIIASVPSKCVEWGLRYSGATSKGTARAVGNMTNDVRAALGGAAAVKGILKRKLQNSRNQGILRLFLA